MDSSQDTSYADAQTKILLDNLARQQAATQAGLAAQEAIKK